ncbi:hypothetical protein, variant [Phytophthora nicotianae CJ01A1]|uniref:Uncharacterized protein n=4 Tax=Phytophthora nicotianae TaxID=4792 RepID=W2QBH9_PHYN3|nr:hypothetical protein, variant [Phytophthora nicotianae INRA-310]ETI47531.1 hypothetical protein, variant [Phytophthora nicotianae P1569]ETK87464.1 hypothetical protein, variant [Phytophthora nicotianae]ETP17328.1 hypothetical protein, variant [Phytophthora nicotianae CJ01A1]ETL40894.1 hypothetical protein, variant [Phytophthora nicotianae]ETL94046.1 hypothetical protein, variant [Phytophthora nicotianae]
MGKKAKRTASTPVTPTPLQPPLKPLRIASPSVALDKHSCNAECSYEYDNLLARSRPGVRPFPPVHDLERGNDGNDGQWQVLHALDGVLCLATHHVLELVQLKRVNFGFRWRDTNVERDADVPPPSCMMGPHWHLMLTTWSVFCFLSSIVNVLTFEKAGIVELGAGVILSGLCLTCYALVGCSDPGIVRRIEMPPDDTYTYCDHCDSYRPEGYAVAFVRS